MTIETVLSAKSIWLMDTRRLNPKGRNLYRLIGPVASRLYGFTEPTEFDETKGVKYVAGEFSPSEKGNDLTGVTLTIFNDGLVAESWTSTADTDLFLGRALEQFAKEGIIAYRPDMVKHKRYATELVVKPHSQIKPPAQFANLYKLLVETVYHQSSGASFEVSGLVFDVNFSLPGKQVSFTFQRRVSVPFEENLYYSHGPFSNEQHELVLNELEKALAV